jgi:large subunit ribosomal protein L9
MKVILNQTVPKVGKEGQVVNVADGFARNFLFPRGLAIVADKRQLEVLEKRQARRQEKLAETQSTAEQLKERLDGQTVRIEGKVGSGTGKLFGAVTAQDVADALKAQLGADIEKKQIALIQPIKRLGRHEVELDLHPQVDATITVNVFDPSVPEETAAEAESETTEEAGEAVEA